MKLFLFSSVFVCTSNVRRIFLAKLCKTIFFAHIGYAVALTANINKIVFHLLKSSFKICSKNKGKKFAKKLLFFQKIFMLFYFLPYRYSTIFFVIFKNWPPKEIFALNFFLQK